MGVHAAPETIIIYQFCTLIGPEPKPKSEKLFLMDDPGFSCIIIQITVLQLKVMYGVLIPLICGHDNHFQGEIITVRGEANMGELDWDVALVWESLEYGLS